MPTAPVDLAALAASFALVTTLFVQLVKPFVELIPGIMLPKNAAVHDNALRLLGYAFNLGLLIAAALTVPQAFAGLNWYDLLAVAFGQSVLSHVTYTSTTSGKVDAPVA